VAFVSSAKPAAEEEDEAAEEGGSKSKTLKGAKEKKKKKATKAPGVASGTMMKKMKEVVETVETAISGIHDDKEKYEREMEKLTQAKVALGRDMAQALGAMALSEDPGHADKCGKEVAKLEGKLKKNSESFFKAQAKREALNSKEYTKRKEFFDMMNAMKTQQDSSAKKRAATVQGSIDKNLAEQSAQEKAPLSALLQTHN
jgi:hypothetical protein